MATITLDERLIPKDLVRWLSDEPAWRGAVRQMVRLLVLVEGLPVMEAIAETIRVGRVKPGTAAYDELMNLATEL